MNRIYFNEVATRDGFQIEPKFIPTDDKVALIRMMVGDEAGRVSNVFKAMMEKDMNVI